MKNLFYLLVAVLAPTLAIAANGDDKTTYTVDVNNSTITWKGWKVVGGGHDGTIALKEGSVVMNGDKLVGGEFVIDMNSINNTDLSGGGKEKLEGHLKSDDFFGVATYPTAKMKITKVKAKDNGYHITADVTIKEKTHPVEFMATVMEDGEWMKANAEITIDRAKYDVRYGSGSFFDNLGDKTISDDFILNVELAFSPAAS